MEQPQPLLAEQKKNPTEEPKKKKKAPHVPTASEPKDL
jgi:hypothetical protein